MYISIGFLLITLHMTSIIIIRGPILPVKIFFFKPAPPITRHDLLQCTHFLSHSPERLNIHKASS